MPSKAYADACAKACPGCAANWGRAYEDRSIHLELTGEMWPNAVRRHKCTAPTPDEFMEQQAETIRVLQSQPSEYALRTSLESRLQQAERVIDEIKRASCGEDQIDSCEDDTELLGWIYRKAVDALADVRGEEPTKPSRPKIICLCGSTRFVDTWINQYQRLSDAGNIVLTVARMPPRPNLQHDEPELKVRLDELHKRKIDLADEVFVLDVAGYIGTSTRSEIEYAQARGKRIVYLSAEEQPQTCPLCHHAVHDGKCPYGTDISDPRGKVSCQCRFSAEPQREE